jgi:UDP-N-acetylmuramate dehydrogenase
MQIINDFPLAAKTTIKIGGLARYYTEPLSVDDISLAFKWARDHGQHVFILGKGSNVLISDKGWNGLVINTASGCDRISWKENRAECECGVLLHDLVKMSVAKGLYGIESLGWIPGTVGGAVVMNAGAFGQTIGEVVDFAEYITINTNEKVRLTSDQLGFGYRTSIFQSQPWMITNIGIKLSQGSIDSLKKAFGEVFERRKAHQPLDTHNCGSIFKNPAGQRAGALIEQCGLKGFQKNGVMISEKHANFIINAGSATAEDFRSMVQHIQRAVFEKAGFLLEPEVVFVGNFTAPLFKPNQ